MSYAQGTTHYNYPLIVASDRPTFADYNAAMRDIDEKLFGLEGDSTATDSRLDAIEAALPVMDAATQAAQNTADTANGKADTNAEQIGVINVTLSQQSAEISDVRHDAQDMITAYNEPSATSTHTYGVGEYFIYNDVLYRATQVINVGDTIVPDTNCITTNIATEISEVYPDNIPIGGYLAAAIVQRRVGKVAELKFGGFTGLTVGVNTLVGKVDDRLKPAFNNAFKVSGGTNMYQIQISELGEINVYAYTAVSDQSNVNPTLVYLVE